TAKRHWCYPERWIVCWTRLLTIGPELIAGQETYAAYINGEPAGFYSLKPGTDRTHLEHLWVLPQAMGQGVARALFTHTIERMKASGIETLEIESDPNAAGFYEHMGARRVGTTVTELEGNRRELPVLVFQV